MQTPEVSVVMPVYNAVDYVSQAVRSVLRQTFSDWELIVVDDGSSDGSDRVLAGFADRIRYIRQSNLGPSSARNSGLADSTGAYVAFLDADDEWDQSFLAEASSTLRKTDDSVAGVVSGWMYSDRSGRPLEHSRRSVDGDIGLRQLLSGSLFPIHAVLCRRAALLQVGGFDPTISAMEDWDLWLRVSAKGMVFRGFGECLASYRLHGTSNSGDPVRMRAGRLRAIEKLFAARDLPDGTRQVESSARARALVQSSAALYSAGFDSEARRDFVAAVQASPGILEDDESYFAVICADQPVGYKATAYPIDFASAGRRMFDALAALPPDACDARGYERAMANAHRTLASLSSLHGLTPTSLRHVFLALRHERDRAEILRLVRRVLRTALQSRSRRPLLNTQGAAGSAS